MSLLGNPEIGGSKVSEQTEDPPPAQDRAKRPWGNTNCPRRLHQTNLERLLHRLAFIVKSNETCGVMDARAMYPWGMLPRSVSREVPPSHGPRADSIAWSQIPDFRFCQVAMRSWRRRIQPLHQIPTDLFLDLRCCMTSALFAAIALPLAC